MVDSITSLWNDQLAFLNAHTDKHALFDEWVNKGNVRCSCGHTSLFRRGLFRAALTVGCQFGGWEEGKTEARGECREGEREKREGASGEEGVDLLKFLIV